MSEARKQIKVGSLVSVSHANGTENGLVVGIRPQTDPAVGASVCVHFEDDTREWFPSFRVRSI